MATKANQALRSVVTMDKTMLTSFPGNSILKLFPLSILDVCLLSAPWAR